MVAPQFVLVQGARDTKRTLARWNDRPWRTVGPWFAGASAITTALLLSVWAIAALSTPDATPISMPGLTSDPALDAVVEVMRRNALVLALHAMACVAGFIAGSSLPLEAERYTGVLRTIHDKAGPMAIAFVVAATMFSLVTQAYVLGGAAATLAAQGGVSPGLLLLGLLPHALPELVALFLPLAAWVVASRRRDWHELLAATVVTVGLAVPILIASAFVEVYVSPHLIVGLRG
jgi:hypothetical protein